MIARLVNIFMVISLTVSMVSCSKDDSSNPNNTSANQTAEIAQSGDWEITYFFDTDKDETSNFRGYTFKFNGDGSLVATNGSTTVRGNWSVTNDSDSSGSDFNINFQVSDSSDFDDLNDDWDIIKVTDRLIELIDISGGNGGTDYLTFLKK